MTKQPTPPAPPPSQPSSPEEAPTDFEDILDRPAIHEHDRVPGWVMRVQGLLVGALSYDRRRQLALVLILTALLGALALSGTHFFRNALQALDIFAYLGLFLVNWVGNGGILVPIPGARLFGLLIILQQALILPPFEVLAVSGAAMALGLVSYYVAGARSADAYEKGDTQEARRVVADTTILAQADQPAPAIMGPLTDPVEAFGGASGASEASQLDQGPSRRRRMTRRFSDSWKRAQERAQPVIEKHGMAGMFWLCLVPSPAATAAAFLGGAMRFGFGRFLLADFASKYLLAGIIVIAALTLGP